MSTFEQYADAYGWDVNADLPTLYEYLNMLGREQAYAFAVGLDAQVKFIEESINVLEEEIENREMQASGYHH